MHPNQIAYLQWWNQFLTVACFASFHGITEKKAVKMINKGRLIQNDNFAPLPSFWVTQ